jgi:4-amino-4-deoxy-L-arabinose transferase-like glycosyltransferase
MMTHRWLESRTFIRITTVGFVLALVVFHAVINWHWLTANVTVLGWDVPSHLGTSFIYDSILRPFSPETLFTAITWHPNRPPLYFLSAVPLYRLFGLSADVGTMVNIFYLAMLFGSVYGIGRQLGGRRVGFLATFVIATLPMIYAISRYFYIELALTAIVALSIYFLLASEGFESRIASLLFGLSLGVGVLTKRTYPVFVFAPLGVVIVRSSVFRSLKRRVQAGFRLQLKDLFLAIGLGLVLAVAWYLPAREVASHLSFGVWLVPLWAVLIAVTVFSLRLVPGSDANLVAALSLGATIGSIWYLPRITFMERLLRFGFGVNDPWERSANLDRLGTYAYFFAHLVNEHVSLVYFFFLIVAVLALVLYLWRKGDVWGTLRRASDAWWVTAVWVVGPYLLLTLSLYRKSRGITPVLPALALILAVGILSLPWKRVVSVLVAMIIGWGLLQFFTLSFEGPNRLAEQASFNLPVLGETSLFARGGAHLLPDDGETDRDYWVVPDILQIVDANRERAGAESAKLGVLVNNEHVNPDLFGLWAIQSYPAIQVQNLARSGATESIYPNLFEYDYLVMIENNYKWIDDAAQDALRFLEVSPGLFEAVFELAQEFPLPDGDTVFLYHKTQRPAGGYDIADYQAVAQTLARKGEDTGAILLVPPDQAEAVGRTYRGHMTPYALPQAVPLEPEGTERVLEEILSRHPILFVVFREEQTVDPDRFIEGWLNEHAYRGQTEWQGGVRLVVFGAPPASAESSPGAASEIQHPLPARLGEQVRLLGYSLAENSVEPGQMLRLTLFWQATATPLTERLAVFAHVLDGEGRLVAQQDSEPAGGSRPTTSWSSEEVIIDRLGILLPADAVGGEYRLVVGMYQLDSGERLPVFEGLGQAGVSPGEGDSILLDTIQVK